MRKKLVALIMVATLALGTISPTMAQQELADAPGVTSMRLYGAEDETPREDQAEVNIKAPKTVKVGSVIVLDLSNSLGDGFDYHVEPMPPDLMTFDDGKVIVCGTGNTNITYTFSVSCALAGDSDLATHKVRVTGAVAPGPPDNPGVNLVDKVKEWAETVSSPTKRDDALRLAQAFSSIAKLIEEDTFSTPKEMANATAVSSADALGDHGSNWNAFQLLLRDELIEMAKQGLLPDVASHKDVWSDIARGLLEYADTIE